MEVSAMDQEFDLITIGTGAGGFSATRTCRAAGWRVAVIDSLPFGGTCALRGCDPKKVLVGAAELIDWNRRMAPHGLTTAPDIDWSALMRFKRSFTEPVPARREQALRDAGIAVFHGRARFAAPGTLLVNDDRLKSRYILLANGARPATLGISGEEHVLHSDEFLNLDKLPARVLFVGGGYISFEFAHLAARAGAQVRIVHRGARALSGFDVDLVDLLMRKTRSIGIEIELGTTLTSVERTSSGLIVSVRRGDADGQFTTDLVVHGAGRVPDIDDLDLERGEVAREKRGVAVDAHLQSVSNSQVYAAGDAAATDGLPLTPVAAMESQTVAINLLEGNHATADYRATPTVVFTLPSLASVGWDEATADQHGRRYETHYANTGGWYSSRRVAESHTAHKVLVEKDTGRILGAHLLGPGAEDTINLFALAVRYGLTADQLKKAVFAYPTHASDISHMV
jgi:glutathione reductase (NADPH)